MNSNVTKEPPVLSFSPPALLLTCNPEEEKHGDPVDPEEHEAEEGPKGLQGQQGDMDEHFPSHMEEGNGESHTLSHEEHNQQQDELEGDTKHHLEIISLDLPAFHQAKLCLIL